MLDVDRLSRSGALRKYNADEIIINEGDYGEEMFVIVSGQVRVFIRTLDASFISLEILNSGEFFGEMGLLEGLPRSASVQAMVDTAVIVISRENFNRIIIDQPILIYDIMKNLSSRLRSSSDEIKKLKKIDIKSRLESNSLDDKTSKPLYLNKSGIINLEESIYPSEHKTYPHVANVDHYEYLTQKNLFCPVCERYFLGYIIRSSKLRLLSTGYDFREHYEDFEPLWYLIWVCPHCYYANYSNEFNQITPESKKSILEKSSLIKNNLSFYFSEPRRINEVLTAHYLTLRYLSLSSDFHPEKNASLWLRLSWLYHDVGDWEMFKVANQQALFYYKEVQYKRITSFSFQDQRLTILLGELNLKNNDLEEALKHFRNSIVFTDGEDDLSVHSAELNKKAGKRIEKVFELMADSKKKSRQI